MAVVVFVRIRRCSTARYLVVNQLGGREVAEHVACSAFISSEPRVESPIRKLSNCGKANSVYCAVVFDWRTLTQPVWICPTANADSYRALSHCHISIGRRWKHGAEHRSE